MSALLPLVALGAKKPDADKFQQFHTKALASAPLKLDDAVYGKLTAAPRDYSVAVLLTALDARFNCQLCREFQPEWNLLGKSWTRGDRAGKSRLVYGTLDFTDGKNTFQSVNRLICFTITAADVLTSWVFKPPPSSYSSHLPVVHMLQRVQALSDMISPVGKCCPH